MDLVKDTITKIDSGAREIVFSNFNSQNINQLSKQVKYFLDNITAVDDGKIITVINFNKSLSIQKIKRKKPSTSKWGLLKNRFVSTETYDEFITDTENYESDSSGNNSENDELKKLKNFKESVKIEKAAVDEATSYNML